MNTFPDDAHRHLHGSTMGLAEQRHPTDPPMLAPGREVTRASFEARVMALAAKARQHESGATINEATYAHGAESGGASWSSVKNYTTPLIDRAAAAEIAAEADAQLAALRVAVEAERNKLLASLEEPDEELMNEFQRAFVDQLHRRKNVRGNKPMPESAERAGIRAMLKMAFARERAALATFDRETAK